VLVGAETGGTAKNVPANHANDTRQNAFHSCHYSFLSSFAEKIWNNRGLRGWRGLKKNPIHEIREIRGQKMSFAAKPPPVICVIRGSNLRFCHFLPPSGK
jgi:hypothetical protein